MKYLLIAIVVAFIVLLVSQQAELMNSLDQILNAPK